MNKLETQKTDLGQLIIGFFKAVMLVFGVIFVFGTALSILMMAAVVIFWIIVFVLLAVAPSLAQVIV